MKLTLALEKAKDALSKDRSLRKLREIHNMVDQINTDLTFSVCLNLANMYEANKMSAEALKTYTLIVKNNNYPMAGRLKVNMGNIYFKQQK